MQVRVAEPAGRTRAAVAAAPQPLERGLGRPSRSRSPSALWVLRARPERRRRSGVFAVVPRVGRRGVLQRGLRVPQAELLVVAQRARLRDGAGDGRRPWSAVAWAVAVGLVGLAQGYPPPKAAFNVRAGRLEVCTAVGILALLPAGDISEPRSWLAQPTRRRRGRHRPGGRPHRRGDPGDARATRARSCGGAVRARSLMIRPWPCSSAWPAAAGQRDLVGVVAHRAAARGAGAALPAVRHRHARGPQRGAGVRLRPPRGAGLAGRERHPADRRGRPRAAQRRPRRAVAAPVPRRGAPARGRRRERGGLVRRPR